MDISGKYVEMCEKAEEIQKLWRFENGDYLCLKVDKIPYVHTTCCEGCKWEIENEENIWLPRQDQLQKMISNKCIIKWEPEKYPLHLSAILEEYIDERIDDWDAQSWQPDSMEKLWLLFVMEKEYNKVWNGTSWKLLYQAKFYLPRRV